MKKWKGGGDAGRGACRSRCVGVPAPAAAWVWLRLLLREGSAACHPATFVMLCGLALLLGFRDARTLIGNQSVQFLHINLVCGHGSVRLRLHI